MTASRIALYALLGALACEALTAACRFGLGLEAARDTADTLGALTLGVRIHHGYLGLLLTALAVVLGRRLGRRAFSLALVVGLALIASDALHHLVVLRLVTGSPELDLLYPR